MPNVQTKDSIVVVLSTAPNQEVAEMIVGSVLDAKLSACISLIPGIQSHYLWKGERCCEQEVLLLMKTVESKTEALRQHVLKVHPYDTPEFIALDAAHVSSGYEAWVRDCLKAERVEIGS